ncbi:hypothetical protein KR51_00025060 [Rubidibacter lacunae KORDI 51-2]|uniref:Uncharacterized protein n=1 Tax=Rubidibacter lacunae KORDI 51-2 TaxID=582515 RepID=U5DJ35_9CHRO|nr:hypothetical protein KR51_00025060 [Rubidibacter lacunae KORDI 51-2]
MARNDNVGSAPTKAVFSDRKVLNGVTTVVNDLQLEGVAPQSANVNVAVMALKRARSTLSPQIRTYQVVAP